MAIRPVTLDKISSVAQTSATSQTKNSCKNIQAEITIKQQHLKRISSDTSITATEREQKRRELQKEIDELNRKLQQKKLEQKAEAVQAAKKQETEAATADTTAATVDENKPEHHDMSVHDIQQMLSADYVVQKERVQEQVDLKKESTIHVLEAEINQDKTYGADTSRKEAELEALQQKENFWSDAQKQGGRHVQSHVINTNAKVVIDQI